MDRLLMESDGGDPDDVLEQFGVDGESDECESDECEEDSSDSEHRYRHAATTTAGRG